MDYCIQGQHRKKIEKAAVDAGVVVNSDSEQPDISHGELIFWLCWNDLCSERNTSERIPWSSIIRWAECHDAANFEVLKHVVWAMDAYYIDEIKNDKKVEAVNQESDVLNRLAKKKGRVNG